MCLWLPKLHWPVSPSAVIKYVALSQINIFSIIDQFECPNIYFVTGKSALLPFLAWQPYWFTCSNLQSSFLLCVHTVSWATACYQKRNISRLMSQMPNFLGSGVCYQRDRCSQREVWRRRIKGHITSILTQTHSS